MPDLPDRLPAQEPLPMEIPEVHVREDLRMTLGYSSANGKLDFSRMIYQPLAISYRRVVTVKTDLV